MSPPQATWTEQRRRRHRRAGWGGVTALLAQATSVIVSTASIPLAANYLGAERYGLWVTLSSALAWVWLGELGFASALTNAIAEAEGRDDPQEAGRVVATAFWVQCAVGAVLLVVAAVCLTIVPLNRVLRLEGVVGQGELTSSVLLASCLTVLTLPLGVVVAVYRGRQETHRANVWGIAGSLAGLVVLVAAVSREVGLVGLVAAVFGTGTGVRAASFGWLFWVEQPRLNPFRRPPDRRSFQRLWILGPYYMGQQLGYLATTQVQPLLLSMFAGPVAAAQFAIAQRVFFLPQQLVLAWVSPLVAAYGEAWARGDRQWVRRAATWTTLVTGTFVLAAATLLYLMFVPLVTMFVGAELLPDEMVVVWLFLHSVVSGVLPAVGASLQGLERARPLAVSAMANAVAVAVGGGVFTWVWGSAGLAATMAISASVTTLVPLLVVLWRVVRRIPGGDAVARP